MAPTQERLSNLASITTGLVVQRKRAKIEDEIAGQYNMLTLKSVKKGGVLDNEALEPFDCIEQLDQRYLTQLGDVIVRLSSPHTAMAINEEQVGFLISALFVIIRIKTDILMPEYLSIILNSENMKRYYLQSAIGSTISIIKASMLKNLKISFPAYSQQEKIVGVNRLIIKEQRLLDQLTEEKAKYHKAIINSVI